MSNVSRRTRITERKAKSADERPVLTEMKINLRSIWSVLGMDTLNDADTTHRGMKGHTL